MKIKQNNLIAVKNFFEDELIPFYESSEIQSFFFWSVEAITGWKKAEALLHFKDGLSESVLLKFCFTVKDLKQYKPIQYIFGQTEFFGLHFNVSPDVLIPRPETEELVSLILENHKNKQPFRLIDLCTGSGCIAISLKYHLPETNVTALDISKEALLVAEKNATTLKTPIRFIEADLSDTSLELNETFDLIVSNPPYVRESEKVLMKPNVLKFEPSLALFVSDEEPLFFYKKIAEFAQKHLVKGGMLYLEINEALAEDIKLLLNTFHFSNIEIHQDLSMKHRMISATF